MRQEPTECVLSKWRTKDKGNSALDTLSAKRHIEEDSFSEERRKGMTPKHLNSSKEPTCANAS